MPFLRVLRDKRGYETTYLMHWFRDGSRQRSRILYLFRTPPGLRVGCDVLDPAVVRELETQHPEIEFDWRALFDNRQVVESSPEPRGRAQKGGAPPGDARKRRREEPIPPPKPVEVIEAPPLAVAAAPANPDARQDRVHIPQTIEGSTRDEQLAFLAKWYPDVRDRIPHRTHDPIRRETLLALAERLNAAGWETEEQIVAGLASAGEALHRLSRVFSKRRRRARKPKPAEPEASPTNGSA